MNTVNQVMLSDDIDKLVLSEPGDVIVGQHTLHLPEFLQIEPHTPGAFYLKPLNNTFRYCGIMFSGGSFISSDGVLTGYLREELIMYLIEDGKKKAVKAQKGKEISILPCRIVECFVFDFRESNTTTKVTLTRNLKTDPVMP